MTSAALDAEIAGDVLPSLASVLEMVALSIAVEQTPTAGLAA